MCELTSALKEVIDLVVREVLTLKSYFWTEDTPSLGPFRVVKYPILGRVGSIWTNVVRLME